MFLIFSIIVCALGAFLVRFFGLEILDNNILNIPIPSWGLAGYTIVLNSKIKLGFLLALVLNTIYLKFLLITKVYFMIRYTNSKNIPNLIDRILYLVINCLFILLIGIIILKNDFALMYTSFLFLLNLSAISSSGFD